MLLGDVVSAMVREDVVIGRCSLRRAQDVVVVSAADGARQHGRVAAGGGGDDAVDRQGGRLRQEDARLRAGQYGNSPTEQHFVYRPLAVLLRVFVYVLERHLCTSPVRSSVMMMRERERQREWL